jgi:site-specific recombinase XerD
MSAAPAFAEAQQEAWFPTNASNREWARLSARAPQLVATMRRYLLQLTTFLAPRSVEVADTTLRQLTRWLTTATDVTVVAAIERRHIEDYKVWLAAQPGQKGQLLAKNTQRHRLRMIRIFLERLIEWDWPDAPGRNPILHGDIPPRAEPIPRFLTDQQAAAFMAAARTHPVPRYRLVAQVLARTGLRASELCELAADSVTHIGTDGHWLRVPVGKLRNDRMIPLHPEVVDLFADWTATNSEHIRATRRLLADDHAPIDRRTVHRIIARIGAIAGIDDMHPHRLRHTLATQAINRGMRLEAIAALLGHHSLEMTLVYAKITDRVVADEYASVCEQIDALYNTAATPGALPAEIETAAMTRLRQEAHARMLGNGMCTRPVELDCRMETICETCAYFETGPQFVPVLLRQRDHARTHRQTDRAKLYDDLITRVAETSP